MPTSTPLHRVKLLENVWIPMDDNTRLSARLWLPQPLLSPPSKQQFSVVLEYIPYRKSDWTSTRDARNHYWLAQRGFAVARVDIRGSGNSEGHYFGEYTAQELADGVQVIAWLSAQPWSSGHVGLFGKSWGGFNGLQLAALAPPALRGVASLYSIDDRYADDIHYIGGAVIGSEALSWASVMFSLNSLPMAPETVGSEAEWLARWKTRLDKQFPWLHEWLGHQTRDEFWEHASICEDYDAVQCPILEIGGWTDGYYNGVARMVEGMTKCERKGVIGPWSHNWPNHATPGPQIGFLEMCRQWWAHSLDGEADNSIESFPDLQLYVKDAVDNPTARIVEYPGKWRSVEDVHDLNQEYVTFQCTSVDYKLQTTMEPVNSSERLIRSQSLQGAWSGEWLSFGGEDMPGNQTTEDALATTWTSSPLPEDLEIIGRPEMSLLLKSNKPQALIMARLCDVSPSGDKSTLITRGVLNLSHRYGHKSEQLRHMPTGQSTRVDWQLNACAYTVRAGHRVLLAVTPSYWPMIWPSPEPVELTVSFAEMNTVRLPILPPTSASPAAQSEVCPVGNYPLDLGTPSRTISLREAPPMERNVTLLLSEMEPKQQLVVKEDQGKDLLVDEGITMEETAVKTYTIDAQCLHPHVSIQRSLAYEKLAASDHEKLLTQFASQVAAATQDETLEIERVDCAEHPTMPWKATVETDSSMTSDAESFFLKDHLIVRLNGTIFFEKRWEKQIPRHFV